MLKEYEERITNAKNKQFRMLERFHIGDAVYPFWLKGFIVYGIVTDVDTVARKIFCDFNGVRRQFCPEDLMHVNPELINVTTAKKRNASEGGTYSKYDETHLSDDTDNGIRATCQKCGGEIAVSYDEKTATSDFVCTKCGQRIPEDKVSKETKKAMKENQMKNIRAKRSFRASGEDYDEFVSRLDGLDLDDTQYGYYREALDALKDGSNSPNDTHGYKSMADVLKDAENSVELNRDDDDGRLASRTAIAKELARIAKMLIRRG